ncbi:Uncharacterized protein Adt_18445 [Abeliophyllum distichum]|uniref:Uncharacterized protein n=1 Tax=Abeliophyllum distichum TaxID=126358 RepID=A0ABD1TJE3_9LAMI
MLVFLENHLESLIILSLILLHLLVTYTSPSTDERIIPTGWTDDDDDHNQWHKKWDWDDNNTKSPVPINMFHPPLTSFDTNQSTHSWKVQNPTTRSPSGSIDHLSPAEKVIN